MEDHWWEDFLPQSKWPRTFPCPRCGQEKQYWESKVRRKIRMAAEQALSSGCKPDSLKLQQWLITAGVYRKWKVPIPVIEDILSEPQQLCLDCERGKNHAR